MAGVNLSYLQLYDKLPGSNIDVRSIPEDGWDSTRWCFKTTSALEKPAYPLGTKITAYSDNSCAPGYYTMAYLMYHSYEAGASYDVSKDFSDGLIWCSGVDSSTAQMYSTDYSTSPWYVVTKCITTAGGDVSTISFVVVPCWTASSDGTLAYTQGYGDSYGWFWCGGVCPALDVTIFDNQTTGIGMGACVTGNFLTYGKGSFFMEHSTTLNTNMITCDITSVGDVTDLFASGTPQPLGYICATAT